jgi:hypothetical protein
MYLIVFIIHIIIYHYSVNSYIITTVAGTDVAGYNNDNIDATSSQINAPVDVTFDSIGNMFFTDWGNDRVRKVSTSGKFIINDYFLKTFFY